MENNIAARIPRIHGKIIILLLLSICAIYLALSLGRFPISLRNIGLILTGSKEISQVERVVLFSLRLPRVLAALFVGAALAGSGAVYQTAFRNPMVSPSVLGASSGAAFGAALAILMGFPRWTVNLLSFLFGLGAVFLALMIASSAGKKGKVLILILTGMLVSTFFTALISLVKFTADPQETLPEITYWLMGSLSGVNINDSLFMGGILITGSSIIYLMRWKIALLSLDEDEAGSMGINPGFYRLLVIICSTMMTSAAVSISGVIGWVGLIIPHIARIIAPSRFDHMFLVSLFTGGIYLLVMDTFSRVISSVEFPLGILTSLIGAPFFAFFLIRSRREV
jgi:iron complex transport system permease protein